MSCKLHIPTEYDPQRDTCRCRCGAFEITAVEAFVNREWEFLFRRPTVLMQALAPVSMWQRLRNFLG